MSKRRRTITIVITDTWTIRWGGEPVAVDATTATNQGDKQMITEMVIVECYYSKTEQTAAWLNKLVRYFQAHDFGQVVQLMQPISGPRNQFHLLINFASLAEYEQKRNGLMADAELATIWAERTELVINATHHFLNTTTFF